MKDMKVTMARYGTSGKVLEMCAVWNINRFVMCFEVLKTMNGARANLTPKATCDCLEQSHSCKSACDCFEQLYVHKANLTVLGVTA